MKIKIFELINMKINIKFNLILFNLILIILSDKFNKLFIYLFNIYKISIIIPFFNREKFIKICLNSVIYQTLKNIEIICIDDGSTDKSLFILKEFLKFDKRIKLISQNNLGSGVARNNGINLSKGKYLVFIDSDDLFPNNYTLELLYNKVNKNKVNICGGGLNEFEYKNGTMIIHKQNEIFTFHKEGIINYLDYQFDLGYYRFIYNNKFIKKYKIYFPEYFRYQDPPFLIKAMALSKQFYALKEITYYYRISNKTWTEKKIIDQYQSFEYSLKLCENYNLNKLYYIIIKRLNHDIFLMPTTIFIKSKNLINLIKRILKNINYDKINKKKIYFDLNIIYKNILKNNYKIF